MIKPLKFSKISSKIPQNKASKNGYTQRIIEKQGLVQDYSQRL